MAPALAKTIAQMPASLQVRESLALVYWSRVVGEAAAASTEPSHVNNGVLYINTKSSTWSQELLFHKQSLLLKLNRMIGGKVIIDLRFRVQTLQKAEPEKPEETPSEEQILAVKLEAPEQSELRTRLEALVSISDDHTRSAIAKRITLEMKLRHWRLERGWRLCVRCNSAHKTDRQICPLCLIE